ncbi:MAG: Asp/Glu/hydantoin racemase [Rhodospirillaceae bacterium]|nr:Asp/Glu/hydantoin racemase [Rhodospirillaceae bacterium]
MKIMIINPNSSQEMTDADAVAARSSAQAGTEIVAVTPEYAPASIESFYDEYLCVPGVLNEIRKGDQQGFDAYIIACYGDPGLHAARELTDKPVIGIAEASLYFACQLAAKISIVTIIPRFRVPVEHMVAGYGLAHKVSVRTTPVYVLDVETDFEGSMEKLRQECYSARDEDEAEAICLGCAGFAEFADGLEAELGIPVLDGVVCATKMAESIIDMGRKTSKIKTYKFPERKGFTGMLATFGNEVPKSGIAAE